MTAATVDTFFEGGATAAKFEDEAFGTIIGGRIVEEPRMTQQKDYQTSEPIFYPDGNPAMQMVITVQAFEPAGEDDGRRSFYVKGQMKQAVGEALKKHGAKAPKLGGVLLIKYVSDKPTQLKNGKPGNPQKIYAAKYEPPAQAAAGQFFDDGPAIPGTPAAAASDVPAGVDPARWAQMNPAQRSQMRDALGLPSDSVLQAPTGGSQFRDEPPF